MNLRVIIVSLALPVVAHAAGQTSTNYRVAADSIEGAGNAFAAPVASAQNYAQSFSLAQWSSVGVSTSANYRLRAGYQAGTDGVDNDLTGDADGDGIPNLADTRPFDRDNDDLTGFAELYGVFGFFTNPQNPDTDADGSLDGAEILAGTNPLDLRSTFKVIAIARAGADVQVTWTSMAGKSYVVQARTTGNFSPTGFSDISSLITVTGFGEMTNTFADVNGVTNAPARFYRVRLGP